MNIFGLGNILSALGLTQKVDSVQKPEKRAPSKANSTSDDLDDTVSISEEAFVKAMAGSVAQKVKDDSAKVDEAKIALIKEKVRNDQYHVSSEDIAGRMLKGATDVYQNFE